MLMSDKSKEAAVTPHDDELKEKILDYLKHAYFNSTTDTMAGITSGLHNRSHAVPVLENYADEIVAAIKRLYLPRQKVVEAIGPDSNPDPYDPDFVSSGEIEDIKLEGQNELRAEIRAELGL
jgi:hypothetical protein